MSQEAKIKLTWTYSLAQQQITAFKRKLKYKPPHNFSESEKRELRVWLNLRDAANAAMVLSDQKKGAR